VECVQGDITQQPDIEVIVNAANGALLPGGGVAGAIHRAAGPELAQECRRLAPIKPGEAVITGGHLLPNRHVVHCLGPVYGVDEPAAALLASCYRRAMALVAQKRRASVAFPAIATGIFGYPAEPAAKIAIETVLAALADCPSVRRVRFVLFSAADLACYERILVKKTSNK
jgi:O-acetyl-ADP-ribose deacetylase (regulator of RNase III)